MGFVGHFSRGFGFSGSGRCPIKAAKRRHPTRPCVQSTSVRAQGAEPSSSILRGSRKSPQSEAIQTPRFPLQLTGLKSASPCNLRGTHEIRTGLQDATEQPCSAEIRESSIPSPARGFIQRGTVTQLSPRLKEPTFSATHKT